MDPITQGLVGALAAQAFAKRSRFGKAAIIGGLSGMAPDLDVLIRSSNDPLLFLEYHRHFTHSLAFIPVGGLLCGLLAFALWGRRWSLSFRDCLLWATLGFATHGLLDACTSYGTRLLWPFSDWRVAWDLVSVIDPLVSLPLLVFVVFAIVKRRKRFLVFAGAWFFAYIGLAFWQHERTIALGVEIASERGHKVERLVAKPGFGNIVVWKTIYESDGTYYVDAVRPGFTKPRIWRGGVVNKLDLQRDLPWLEQDSQQARDIERFRHFSDGFVAVDPESPNRIADIRYSTLPNQVQPLWGIELSPTGDKDKHADYYTQRDGSREAMPMLWSMIIE